MKFTLLFSALGLFILLLALFSDGRHWLNYRLYSGRTQAKVHEIRPFTVNDSRSAVEQQQPDGTWIRLQQTEDRAVQLRPYGFLLFEQNKPMVRFLWEAEGGRFRGNYRYMYRTPLWNVDDTVELHYLPAKPWMFEVENPRLSISIFLKAAFSIILILAGVITGSMIQENMSRKDTAENRLYGIERMRQAAAQRPTPKIKTISTEHGADYEIVWEDEGLEEHIRYLLNKETAPILHSDVWDIQSLTLFTSAKIEDRIGTTDCILYSLEDGALPLRRLYDGKAFPTIQSLNDLKHFDNLQILDILLPDPLEDISGIANCRNLKSVNLSAKNWNGLQNCEDLLCASVNIDASAPFSELSGLLHLEELAITASDEVDLSGLSSLLNLKSLTVNAKKVSSLEPLTQLSSLVYLDLGGADVPSFEPLTKTGLQYLDLGLSFLNRTKYTATDSNMIARIQDLTYLDLSYFANADMELCSSIIAECPELLYLDISYTPAAKNSGELNDENILALIDMIK